MTEQEAEVLSARLTRIWEPIKFSFDVNFVAENGDYRSDFEYDAELGSNVTLRVKFGQ